MARHRSGLALVFARTDTSIFQDHVFPTATAVLFLKGRLHFHRPDGTRANFNSGGPSCLISWSKADADALRACGLPGRMLEIPPAIDDSAEE